MSSTTAVITRIAITAAGAAILLTATSRAAEAQAVPGTGWEFMVTSGTVVPTGAQRDAIRRGGLTAAQLTYAPSPSFALTSSLGWARSRDIATAGDPKLDVFTYDVGAEVRAHRLLERKRLSLTPFAGIGAGGRSYNYRSLDVDATHNAAAYASAGGELGLGRVRMRVEARNYVSGFKPLVGAGATDTRNDVAVTVGFRIVR